MIYKCVLVIASLSACASHVQKPHAEPTAKALCPLVAATAAAGTGEIDPVRMEEAKKGCIRHYGPGACLVQFVKVGPEDYRAICRRAAK